jgi:hypothetical protein
VKQEIAKEGILGRFWAKSYSFSWKKLRATRADHSSESTPVPALFLHWFFTTILVIAAVVSLRSTAHAARDAYFFVVSVYAYSIDVIVFAWVSLGMLYLRIAPGSQWYLKSPANHWVSMAASLILLTGTAFPLICMWIPDPDKSTLGQSDTIPWYVSQTVGAGIFFFAFLYWLGFKYVAPHIGGNGGKTFTVQRRPYFRQERDLVTEQDYLIQAFEIVKTSWILNAASHAEEVLTRRGRKGGSNGNHQSSDKENPFESMYQPISD